MEMLGKLFGSSARVKLMRVFLFHPGTIYDTEMLSRTRVPAAQLRKELNLLHTVGFLRKRSFRKPLKSGKGSKTVSGWVLDDQFPLVRDLQALLIESDLIEGKDLAKRLQATGKVKLLILTGIFSGNDRVTIDMLIVGDKFQKNLLKKTLAVVESEVGKELRYVVFTPDEFRYRMSMYDSFLREILSGAHQKVINTLGDGALL